MQYFSEKTEEDLLASTSLFERIKDPVFLMKKEQNSFLYMYINPAAIAILTAKDIIGKRIEDVLPPSLSETVIHCYQEAELTQEPVEFLANMDTGHGEFIGETILNPLLDKDGQCRYILAIVRDVTERERKKSELQQTKKEIEIERIRLTSLVENNSNAVFEFDEQKNFIHINNMVTQVTGFSEQELLGHSIVSIVLEPCLKETLSNFDQALKGTAIEFETAIYTKNGSIASFYVNTIPIIVDEKVIGVYAIAKEITEQKKTERLLRESEQRYKSLFDHHPHGIFTFDRDGNLESGNAQVENITGYPMEELIKQSFKSLLLPKEMEKIGHYFHRTVKEKQPERYELTFYNKTGQLIELQAMNIPIIVNEKLVGIYGIVTDITEVRNAHRLLREAKENLEVFWENSTDPIFYIDTKGDILKVNSAFEEMFEFTEEEMVAQKGTIIPAHMLSDQFEIVERIKNGETVNSHDTIRITKSGKALNIISSYSPVRNADKEIIGATIIYKNVTELKKAEVELQKSQEKYQIITESTFDIITLINLSGTIEYISPANKRILGYDDQLYIGSPFTTNVHPEDAFKLIGSITSLIEGAKSDTVEIRFRHRDGHYIWMEVSPTPVLQNGEVKQLFTIAKDITERKRLQDKIAKMAFYDHLSGIPNRRTFDDRLQKALHQAEQSDKKLAVLMLDGHKFKQINDQFGHDAGDAVIKEMALRLQDSVRPVDTAARLGGDEMGVVLTEVASLEEAENMAKKILQSFEAPFHFNGHDLTIGAGIGISLYPDHTTNEKQLIKYADLALYEAKKLKHNAYKVYRKA